MKLESFTVDQYTFELSCTDSELITLFQFVFVIDSLYDSNGVSCCSSFLNISGNYK